MDDLEKHASSYQQDQEILDARGINMTVEEVAGLPTVKYSEKVLSLHLNEGDLSFLKGLRRRIKNRLASQNSRRRSLEHLRRLTRELRAVRARRDDALAERRALLRRRDAQRDRCRQLREHIALVLHTRSDPSQIPDLEDIESQTPKEIKKSSSPDLSESYRDQNEGFPDKTFECRLDKLVQKSVNHIFEKKKVSAKTIFLEDSDKLNDKSAFLRADTKTIFDHKPDFIKHEDVRDNTFVNGKSMRDTFIKDSGIFIKEEYGCKVLKEENGGVLDLCVKEKRRSHGRKQSAPRRIAYAVDYNDVVLDLKIKKENQ